MATWDSYTQKATPEDNDTLMIKDTAGAANKRTPFSGVWNWIVNKLTSAVISNLQTNSKSIIPAINELNSNAMKNTFVSALGKGSSWNNATPGTYWFNLYTGSGGSGYPPIDDLGVALYFKGASDNDRMITIGANCIQIGVKTDGEDFVWNHIDYQ